MIAQIAVSTAVFAMDKPYSYRIPEGKEAIPGMRVIVPFGRGNRKCEGLILAVSDSDDADLKTIERFLDDTPILSEQALRLAAFICQRYFCTFYDAVRAMLPAGHWYRSDVHLELTDEITDFDALIKRKPDALQVAKLLKELGGQADLSELRKQFPSEFPLDSSLQYLQNKKLIKFDSRFSKRTKDSTEQIALLNIPAEEALQISEHLQRSAPMQSSVLRLLCSVGCGSTKELGYLTGASLQTIKRLEKAGYIQFESREIFRCPLPDSVPQAAPIRLNGEQQVVLTGLLRKIADPEPGVSLLYGVTGSGKTAVYISLIQHQLSLGKSSILLVPEISLTPQLIRLLMSHFGDSVAVLHSALRVSERYDEWKRIHAGKAKVVIGTRSAIFAPVQNLGCVIVDEEHEHTYKSENAPRYHAREIAIYRGTKERALVLLGSATPSMESMYHAKSGTYEFFSLRERYNGKELPRVDLVDMKQELHAGNNGCISSVLRDAIAENLANRKQSILFLNRRGAGRCMICVDCGEVPSCPRCSVSLTYHAANQRLMCHHCGYSEPMSERCKCGGHRKIVGSGTQKIETELETLFPDTKVLRMDADVISARNTHEDILHRFQEEKIPILIGTQMVTKGLNFEDVTLVGVVDADMSLYVDHYRAAEETFSMITQVVGRSGRGAYAGKAIIQTMTPEHHVLQLAAKQDYDRFYETEISLRQLRCCPPFGDQITLLLSGPFDETVYHASQLLKNEIIQTIQSPAYAGMQIRLLGPAPASIAKINNAYRYRIIIRCHNHRLIRQMISVCLRNFARDKRTKGVTAFADINSNE